MKIICLEGCHGCGKTTLVNDLKVSGELVLDELFIDMPSYKTIASQSLTMETIWIASWVNRLLALYDEHKDHVLYADRSPYSAVFYSKASKEHQENLKGLIDHQLKALVEAGIDVYTVCLSVDREQLWQRILLRLEFEPIRKQYNEGSRAWMEETLDWYESIPWDFTIDNTQFQNPPRAVLQPVLDKVLGK